MKQYTLRGTLWRVSWHMGNDGLVSPLLQFDVFSDEKGQWMLTQPFVVSPSCDAVLLGVGDTVQCTLDEQERILAIEVLEMEDAPRISLSPDVCPVCRTPLTDGRCLCVRCGAKSQRLLHRFVTAVQLPWSMADRHLFQYLITIGRITSPDELLYLTPQAIKELDTNLFSDDCIYHFIGTIVQHACTVTIAHILYGYFPKAPSTVYSCLRKYDEHDLAALLQLMHAGSAAEVKEHLCRYGTAHGLTAAENAAVLDILAPFDAQLHPENHRSLTATLTWYIERRAAAAKVSGAGFLCI